MTEGILYIIKRDKADSTPTLSGVVSFPLMLLMLAFPVKSMSLTVVIVSLPQRLIEANSLYAGCCLVCLMSSLKWCWLANFPVLVA